MFLLGQSQWPNTSVRQDKHILASGFTFSVQERSNPGPLAVLTSSLIWLQLESRFNSTTLVPACETACDLRQLRIGKNCMGFASPRTVPQHPARHAVSTERTSGTT